MNALNMLCYFIDLDDWEDALEKSGRVFRERFRVSPNIVVVNRVTYDGLLDRARRAPFRWMDYREGEGTAAPCFSPREPAEVPPDWALELFSCPSCTVAFAIDEALGDGIFRVVYDEAPDFGGEPADADIQLLTA